MWTAVTGFVVFAITGVMFWYCLPRDGKYHRFVGTELERELESRDIGHLVVTGAQTEYCVDATVRRAASLGYDVTLVTDGHTTSASRLLSREQIIAHHNRTLPGLALVGARIAARSAAEVLTSSTLALTTVAPPA